MAALTNWKLELSAESIAPGQYAYIVRQLLADQTYGEWWNEQAGAFQAAQPSNADAQILLTEDPLNYHRATHGAFADWSGRLQLFPYDAGNYAAGVVAPPSIVQADSGLPAATDLSGITAQLNSIEGKVDRIMGPDFTDNRDALDRIGPSIASAGLIALSEQFISQARTWYMQPTGDGAESPNIIQINAGSPATTLAIDWRERHVLNPLTGVNGGTIQVISGDPLTITEIKASQDRGQLHAKFAADSDKPGNRQLLVEITGTDNANISGQINLKVAPAAAA